MISIRSLAHGLLLATLLVSRLAALPLIPGHLPVGSPRPLEAGDRFTLAATRLFLAPSFADSSYMLGKERQAEALGARGSFYQLRLEPADGAPGRTVWVYRSELEVLKLADQPGSVVRLPERLSVGQAASPPATGDTLVLASPLLFDGPDLLGEHQVLPGRQVLRVLTAESAQGFLKVRVTDGRAGWLHRAELAEERRRPR